MRGSFLVLLCATFLSISISGFLVPAFAQEKDAQQVTLPANQISPMPNVASNKIIESLSNLDNKIPLGLPAWLMLGMTLIIELLMRFIPSAQPRSVLLLVALGMNLLASILVKSSFLLDKVAQKLKADKKE